MAEYYKTITKMIVAVDCLVFGFENDKLKLLILRRQIDPGRDQRSLPGGFVEPTESVEDSAERVLYNLTGLKKLYLRQIMTYSNPTRDAGGRVVSVALCALINVKDYDEKLKKKDGVEWVDMEDVPKLYADHNQMVEKALTFLQRDIYVEPLVFNLLPPLFTLTQLQHVYEAILGFEIDKRNFRKRVKTMASIEKTNLIDKTTSKRGAALYRFNQKLYEKELALKKK